MGYSISERIGRNLFEHVHPDDMTRVEAAFEYAIRNHGVSEPIEHRLRHKNGSWLKVESMASFRQDPRAGDVWIIHSRDVAARKPPTPEVQQLHKMEAVGLVTSTIAHDFNNTLLVIGGYADLLWSQPSATVRDLTAELRKATQLGIVLTRQLMTFARPSALDLLPASEVNDVVADLRWIVERLVGESIAVSFALDAAPSQATISRGPLGQILINLAVNARDAMSSGGTLAIATRNGRLQRDRRSGGASLVDYVVLEVTDTGVGMTDAVKARIFDPFFTTKPPGRGTGLGLRSVFGIVETVNGWIDVTTEPGRGTTFRVYLPVHSPA